MTPTQFNNEFILPDAASVPGRVYILRNIANSENAVLYSFGGIFFEADNRVGVSPYTMSPGDGNNANSFPTKTVTLISDGINWTVFPAATNN